MFNLAELEEKTVQWSYERGILTNGKATTQALKLDSESGELASNLHIGSSIKDDIGDCMVVLTNLSRLLGFNSLEECEPDFDNMTKQTGVLVYFAEKGKLSDHIIKGNNEAAGTCIGNCIYQLIVISESLGTDLTECWNIAYEDIKDRKGFLNKNGTFIKSTDDNYEQLLMEFENEQ